MIEDQGKAFLAQLDKLMLEHNIGLDTVDPWDTFKFTVYTPAIKDKLARALDSQFYLERMANEMFGDEKHAD